MDKKDHSQIQGDIGYLVVRVSTARGAIPLEGAAVIIRGGTPETSGVIYSQRSNSDGLTDKVSLPAPPHSFSESPGNPTPYSLWNVDVFKEGYVPVSYQNLPVYSSIVSVQPAVMLPIPEGYYPKAIFEESKASEL